VIHVGLEVPQTGFRQRGSEVEVAYLHFVLRLCCNIPGSTCVIQIIVWNLVDLYLDSIKRYVWLFYDKYWLSYNWLKFPKNVEVVYMRIISYLMDTIAGSLYALHISILVFIDWYLVSLQMLCKHFKIKTADAHGTKLKIKVWQDQCEYYTFINHIDK